MVGSLIFLSKLSESTCTLTFVNFTEKYKVLYKSFCEGFPNSAAHTSKRYF